MDWTVIICVLFFFVILALIEESCGGTGLIGFLLAVAGLVGKLALSEQSFRSLNLGISYSTFSSLTWFFMIVGVVFFVLGIILQEIEKNREKVDNKLDGILQKFEKKRDEDSEDEDSKNEEDREEKTQELIDSLRNNDIPNRKSHHGSARRSEKRQR